ncbi:unnamed protein product [Didymodactylos carnosus]|uniref:Anion exchange protein n=1 Tax=Didymodactylos carnosus TaxID=1234261 RepID=A0A813XJP6_9BILA|nr:unnamed protein product [Didymodactylos carnosus]CAF0865899.1 unnamed protein product [Didymodactylos carnosus]CAF3503046.1 unnamed protein product [Didymodactylos carnosus]CAF3653404.1 unnamed protein product [Didymodactylos carnosus]
MKFTNRYRTLYVGAHMPFTPTERKRKAKKRGRGSFIRESDGTKTDNTPTEHPSQRVQFLLGAPEDEDDEDEEHKPHDLFIELDELVSPSPNDAASDSEVVEQGWKETARWVKFEEDVESGGRWSKPHVATLSLHSLLELRKCLLTGSVMLDMHAENLGTIADMILDDMVAADSLPQDKRQQVRNALMLKHIHQHEKTFHKHLHREEVKKPLPFTRSLAEFSRNRSQHDVPKVSSHEQMAPSQTIPSSPQLPTIPQNTISQVTSERPRQIDNGIANDESNMALTPVESRAKLNQHFMKKIPPGSEATNVLIGAVDFLTTPVYAFVRLAKGVHLGDLTEVPLPTRFLFILLGPQNELPRYHEIGRSISTLMSDEIFHDVAYRAHGRNDLLAGIDDFLDHVIVLPPGEWDPNIRIEPPKNVQKREERLDRTKINGVTQMLEEDLPEHEADPTLVRTGKFCGGLIQDIKRKLSFYWSDIRDAFSFQSVAAVIFLYFACLSPIITFGGLLSKATDNNMAAFESLLSGAICGCLYHLFAGQPLTIVGSTGPVLVFETIVNQFCKTHGFDYMGFRVWVGLWTSAILLIMVMTDASYLVKYITRFTEESFAALIGIIFIYEAFDKTIDINKSYPFRLKTEHLLPDNCSCIGGNLGNLTAKYGLSFDECMRQDLPLLSGDTCPQTKENAIPNVFLFSLMLFLSTFVMAYTFKNFKFTRFLPMALRSKISDFGVVLAIALNVLIDFLVGITTPKLEVPQKFETTLKGRGWFISPFNRNPWWLSLAAFLPALLVTILIFMDQQITAVIVNRKENKLKKGCGYHLDLLIVALCIAINSLIGLPWFVAATVLSINHVISLKLESETAAPGEKPQFLGVREQRVTGFIVFLLIGLSVFLTNFLRFIPMPVLYGVFLYMGISSMKEIQLISRLLLMLMPEKYQPDMVYLRHVRTVRVHIFTIIQLTCLILLWVIKSVKKISILFPIMVLALVGARKAMDYIFTQRELSYLDDVMPESTKKAAEDRGKSDEDDNPKKNSKDFTGEIRIPLADGKIVKVNGDNVKIDPSTGIINISDEVAKTFLWKSIANVKETKDNSSNKQKRSSESTKTRGSGIKRRIRNLSLNFIGDDHEERPLMKNVTNTQTSTSQSNQQQPTSPMPSIIIERPDSSSVVERTKSII